MTNDRIVALRAAAARGAAAGAVGAAVMTAGEKLEQLVTGRADSYVPARALRALGGATTSDDDTPVLWNHAMHWGTGVLLGALRGVWAVTGIRGAEANAAHTTVRLAFDQTVENATGVGAPPSTWPSLERRVDLAHKAVYSFATGFVADRWIAPRLQSRRGLTSH